jgi:hypothetical protein
LPPLPQPRFTPSSSTPNPSSSTVRRFERPPTRFSSQYPGAPRNICRRFNSPAGCPTSGTTCEVGTGSKKFTLHHLCLASIGQNVYCLQPHSLSQHPTPTSHN